MWKRAFIYGAAIAAAGVLLTAALATAGLRTTGGTGQLIGLLGFVIPIVGIVLAIRAAKRAETGEFTFGEGFKEGAAVTMIAALLSGVLTYLYLTAVNPDYLETVRQATEAELQARGYSEREMAAAQGMTSPGAVAGFGAFGQVVFGLIVSAVAALFMRRKADPASYT